MRARNYIETLASSGRYHFTTDDALTALSGSAASVRGQLRRLKDQGLIAEPLRSFHVIVPPEYRSLGCLPADQFIDQLMELRGETYYLALLTAAERHGAAHQRPQSTQVMVRKNRQAIHCGKVRVEFIARGDIERMPVVRLNTPRGFVRCSTPEVTALELAGYPGYAGGMGNVASVISELAQEVDPEKLTEAARLSPVSWSQRLGYLLELAGDDRRASALEGFVREHARSWTPLRRASELSGGKRLARWKLIVNTDVEPEA